MNYRTGFGVVLITLLLHASPLLGSETALTVGYDHDTANIDPASISVSHADTPQPAVSVSPAQGWRHFLFSVSNTAGKHPVFRVENNKGGSSEFTNDWAPLWTTDFVSYARFPGFRRDDGDLVFQADTPFTDDTIYVVSHPTFRVQDATRLAETLLENEFVSPSLEADDAGVLGTTPSESGQFDRGDVGEHPIYGLTLDWGGDTTDGERKRVLVMMNGIHAGEVVDGYAYQGAVEWMLNDSSQQAADFRANWIVHLYFNLTPNGRFDGRDRRNNRSYTDPNRDWNPTEGFTLFETALVRDAILADTAFDSDGHLDVFFSFHGWRREQEFLYFYPKNHDPDSLRAFEGALTSFEHTVGNARFRPASTERNDAYFGMRMGARISITNEFNQLGPNDPDRYKQVGSYHVRALQLLDQDGFFETGDAL